MTKFFAYVLVTVGGLIAGLSGLCSLTMLAVAFAQILSNAPGSVGTLSMVLVFGGLPFLIGAGLFAVGVYLLRQVDRRES